MTLVPVLKSLCAASLVGAVACHYSLEQPSCQYNIVSSTVVAAYCSHREGDNELVDLLIAWRGQPGWFGDGATGGGGRRRFVAWTNGRVSQSAIYNDVTIAFDADFDSGTVAIGDVTVTLTGVNALLIDQVERADARPMPTRLWIEPDLPLGLNVNLVMAQRSRELLKFIRCEVPMPAASPRRTLPRPHIVTVCEKLAARRD
jgi:hypothetical protein